MCLNICVMGPQGRLAFVTKCVILFKYCINTRINNKSINQSKSTSNKATITEPPTINLEQTAVTGGLIFCYRNLHPRLSCATTQTCLAHMEAGFLLMQSIIIGKQSIQLTHFDKTMKMLSTRSQSDLKKPPIRATVGSAGKTSLSLRPDLPS